MLITVKVARDDPRNRSDEDVIRYKGYSWEDACAVFLDLVRYEFTVEIERM